MILPLENRFVCLDDITCRNEEYNPVIYNPNIDTDEETRKRTLIHALQDTIGMFLTEKDLDSLVKYDCTELNIFVRRMRKLTLEYLELKGKKK